MRKIESFRFKKFSLEHSQSAQKIGTDSVLLATWIEHHNPRRILDIGSGCGLISFILAQRFPNSEIVGIEIDKESHDESLINLNSFPLATKLSFINADFLEYDFENLEFDCNNSDSSVGRTNASLPFLFKIDVHFSINWR
tara:strand:+ start:26 stop:445 length:420 start_codon:yes stop_codon:yes gene_type:complete